MIQNQLKFLLFSSLFAVLLNSSFAQSKSVKDTAYLRVVAQRAEKITRNLDLQDSSKFYKVSSIIGNQYVSLRTIHDDRNAKVKAVKADTLKTKAERDTLIKKYEIEANTKLAKLHVIYLKALSKYLTQEQIDKVKDGMTFGKVKFTYDGYIQMIPSLTEVQKKQIYDWLIEAREKAMDAESSDKKTTIFGNYKGRIANYLSKEGYDLKKEGEEWNKRIKAQEEAKKQENEKK
jgi:hypothetical protein